MLIRFKGNLQTKAVGKSFNYLKPIEYIEVEASLWNHIAASADIDVNIFALYKFR